MNTSCEMVDVRDRIIKLTEREIEVLETAREVGNNRDVADRLLVSKRTVEDHLSNIRTKLQVDTTKGAIIRALKIGILPISLNTSFHEKEE